MYRCGGILPAWKLKNGQIGVGGITYLSVRFFLLDDNSALGCLFASGIVLVCLEIIQAVIPIVKGLVFKRFLALSLPLVGVTSLPSLPHLTPSSLVRMLDQLLRVVRR